MKRKWGLTVPGEGSYKRWWGGSLALVCCEGKMKRVSLHVSLNASGGCQFRPFWTKSYWGNSDSYLSASISPSIFISKFTEQEMVLLQLHEGKSEKGNHVGEWGQNWEWPNHASKFNEKPNKYSKIWAWVGATILNSVDCL